MSGPDIAEWYRAYADDVYTFLAYSITRQDVEDLVQETFVRALRGLDGYNGAASPRTWLMRIARNVAIDHLRKKRPTASESFLEELTSRTADPADTAVERDQMRLMLGHLAAVRPAYRQVVVLRAVMDYSIQETAGILGWSSSKVSVTYHRAIKELQQFIAREKGGSHNGLESGSRP
ncbi:sigma-70 family RNA polymerase sigma factor [Alicyclobacillus tolerans]|uniref:RNA polymerase sigma factor n=1 Tax=Alicyclobacillus tolerans TaxID=90970 RepID=UPI001F424327|nr:sigma-70 family RNA polymerase sigma factor [Alicyclobacillus tolerans]MCF8566524.1 sigma-70 family RNA polymerase sigma factor [Alicyclobacillus tolerans]